MTDAVLADSLTRAPITDIVVGEPTGSSSFDITVTYTIGGQPASEDLLVTMHDGKDPGIYGGTTTLSIDEHLDVTVHGVTPTSDSPTILPGSYLLVPTVPYLTLGDQPLLAKDSSDYLGSYDLELSVTDEGIAVFREKVIAEAEACLASKALDPGCGAALPSTLSDGSAIRDGSVQRSQDAESRALLQNITPEPGYSLPTVVSVYGSDLGTIDITAECQNSDGSWSSCELWGYGAGFSFGDPSINLADPALTVEWD